MRTRSSASSVGSSRPGRPPPASRAPDVDRLATVLFGRGKRAILAQLFGHADRRYYVREIARAAGAAPSLVQRDLGALTDAGILERTQDGRQVYYQANPRCPIFEELKGIATKTFGIGEVLRQMLDPYRSTIRLAFVYGSVAAGTHTARSDVDLMLVGDLELSQIARSLLDAEQRLGRSVSPTMYPPAEFRAKAVDGNHFIRGVLARPVIFLIGDSHELERILQAEPAKTRRKRASQA
jgi:DNA-binding transcriptional ArsR family regulator